MISWAHAGYLLVWRQAAKEVGWMWMELRSAAANGTARPQSALKRDQPRGVFFDLLYYCFQQTIIACV